MQILTSRLPSGYKQYDFSAINVRAFTYKEIIDYNKEYPKDKRDTLSIFLYNLTWLKKMDENISKILIIDIPFILFIQQSISVSKDFTFSISIPCDVKSSHKIYKDIKPSELDFDVLDEKYLTSAVLTLSTNKFRIKIPTVEKFEMICNRYVPLEKITDLSLLRILSCIEEYDKYPNEVEKSIINSTDEDIARLELINNIYFNLLKPMRVYCPYCNEGLNEEDKRGMLIDLDSLISNPFHVILENYKFTISEAISFEVQRHNED